MAAEEAKAHIKINKLLEESGWRFFDDATGKANIVLEPNVKLTKAVIDALGDNFEDVSNGFVALLLLNEANDPLLVLNAKSDDKIPLVCKEQVRKYAKSPELPIRYVLQRQPRPRKHHLRKVRNVAVEHAPVNANKQLIKRFEAKVKATINRDCSDRA